MSNKAPDKAHRIQPMGYCNRSGCGNNARFKVYGQNQGFKGDYCNECSQFLVKALNALPKAVVRNSDIPKIFANMPETEKPREASRRKGTVASYCERTNCAEWAAYTVLTKEMENVGAYCRNCSEFLVHALNNMPPSGAKVVDIASFFPPL